VKARRILIGVLAAACGGVVLWAALGGGGGGETAPPPPPAPATAPEPGAPEPAPAAPAPARGPAFSHPSQCRECHPAVYDEWESSMHGKAWSDPEVRSLSENFRTVECISCHAPQPIHFAPLGGRAFERSSRFETGVDCLSCHLLPGGGVAAARDLPDAPCRPIRTDTLRQAVSCKSCHNQHYLVDEWETLFSKPDAAKGALLKEGRPETCIDCHMKPVSRGAGPDGKERFGVDHRAPGGKYVDVLRSGVVLRARVEGRTVIAEVANTATGHKAPADSRHRSFNVWVTVTTEGGVKVQDRAEVLELRMYYRSPPRENTNLRPGETATGRLDLPAGTKGKVLVELVYALNPFKKALKEALPVQVEELPFDTTR